MEKHPLIRAIYLYLFTLVGLVLIIIGAVRFIDMGLKVFVFKQADVPQMVQEQYSCQYLAPVPLEKLQSAQSNDTSLTPDEQQALKTFLDNYQNCLANSPTVNYLASQRQKDASMNLAMIIVGLPLYLYHWMIIKKETKEKELSAEDESKNNS